METRGVRKSKTFRSKATAKEWAAKEEMMILDGGGWMPDVPFKDLLMRHHREHSGNLRSRKWELKRIQYLIKHYDLANISCRDLSVEHVAAWRDERLKTVSANTVRREWVVFSTASSNAVREWKWLRDNPFKIAKRPPPDPDRTRRVSDEEIKIILYAAGYDRETTPKTKTARVGAALLFAIETAMRSGEILRITWEDVYANHVHLPVTKNGHPRDVPLSSEAKRIIEQLKPLDMNPIFGLNDDNRSALFRKIMHRTDIEDLHFHDTRREALTRLSKVFSVMELAKISGHRDLRILQNVYYAPTVDDLSNKLS